MRQQGCLTIVAVLLLMALPHVSLADITLEKADSASLSPVFQLGENRPNPFDKETKISFQIPAEDKTEFWIYNVLGQIVERRADSCLAPGWYTITWIPNDTLNPGIYFYKLAHGEHACTKKMVMTK